MKACDRESMNDQLLKFDTLLDSVMIEQFQQTLSFTMRLVDGVNPHSGTGSNSGYLKEPDKKKQKKLEDTKEHKVDNKKPIKHFSSVCVRFHTKGFCLNDCVIGLSAVVV